MRFNIQVAAWTLFAFAGASFASSQDITTIDTYLGKDPGATIGSPIPISQAAAQQFDNAAAALGALHIITYENLLPGPFVSQLVAPGVTVDLVNNEDPAGIAQNGWFSGFNPAVLGYNITPGGEKFLGQVPISDSGTTTVRFTFTTPVQAFGSYITGLEQLNGDIHIRFNDGSSQDIAVAGNPNDVGGAMFFGLTDATRPITSFEYVLPNVSGPRDIYGLDDTRYVFIPEPATLALMLAGAAVIRRVRGRAGC